MPSINGPEDGPVAVTGASGYIGSHIVKNLVESGYTTRACVRDTSREDKTACLLAIGEAGPGNVELHGADLMKAGEGAYDEVFAGCTAVFHVAADLGTDKQYGAPTPQRTYDSCMEATRGVLASCEKSGTVKRVIYTSSAAAVMGSGPGFVRDAVYTEDDWAGGSYDTLEERYSFERDGVKHLGWNIEYSAYTKGKVDAEIYGYQFGERTGIDVVSICPCHVLGPLLAEHHNGVFQKRLGIFLSGDSDFPPAGINWNIIDVRDIAETQRLAATSDVAKNGTRYMTVATDESGEPTMAEFIERLQRLFPDIDVAGDYQPDPSTTRLRARCTKAIEELGLKTHSVDETLSDTGKTLIELGCITPAMK